MPLPAAGSGMAEDGLNAGQDNARHAHDTAAGRSGAGCVWNGRSAHRTGPCALTGKTCREAVWSTWAGKKKRSGRAGAMEKGGFVRNRPMVRSLRRNAGLSSVLREIVRRKIRWSTPLTANRLWRWFVVSGKAPYSSAGQHTMEKAYAGKGKWLWSVSAGTGRAS
jgi:hypothetical protein